MSKWSLSEITEKISEIIVDQLAVKREEVKPNATFSDLGADSLDTVELGMAVENEFDIKLEDKEVEKLTDVQSLIDLIVKKVN